MFLIKRALWLIYLFFFASSAFYRAYIFFHHGSDVNFYFFFLTSFSNIFRISYILSFLQITSEIIQVAVVFLFTFKIRIFKQELFQLLLLFRIFLDLFGHQYEFNNIISIFSFDPIVLIAIILPTLLIYYPSYAASYKYSFGKTT